MGKIVLPYTLENDTDAEAGEVQANFNAITSQANGSLSAGLNILVASAGTISGHENEEGSSQFLARADHAHAVQGVEQLTAHPTTDLFVGRRYFNTADLKEYLCIGISPPLWVVAGNPGATDLVKHASQHASDGSDALPNLAVVAGNLSRPRSEAQIKADAMALSADTWIDATDDFTVQTVPNAAQTVLFTINVKMNNTGTGNHLVGFRLRDKTSTATNAKVWPLKSIGAVDGSNFQDMFSVAYLWTAPATADGAHTLSLQAWCDATVVNLQKTLSYGVGTQAVTGTASLVQWVVG